MPLIHPGAVGEGDLVKAECHLVMEAGTHSPPRYLLHLESLTVLALCPDKVPDNSL